MAESLLHDETNLRVKPLCKPDVHLKRSRRRIFSEDSIDLIYSFGYQSSFGNNLCVLKEDILVLCAGNYLSFLNINSMEEKFLATTYGSSFTCVSVHPSMYYFAAAEKGKKFCVNVLSYPALKVCKHLKEESSIMPTCAMQFHSQGDLLVTVSFEPEGKVSIWNWEFELVLFISDDSERPIYSLHFSTCDNDVFITSGKGHVTFWRLGIVRDDRDLIAEILVTQNEEVFVEWPKVEACCTVSIADTFLSATNEGHMLLWDAEELTSAEAIKIAMTEEKPCHEGSINHIIIYNSYIITLGSDGFMKALNEGLVDKNEGDPASRESLEAVMRNIYLFPEMIILISETSDLAYGVICSLKSDDITCVIQDKSAILFQVVISTDFSDVIVTEMLSGHGCFLVGLDACPSYPFLVAASLGTVTVYDCIAKEVLKSDTFSVPVTCIIWPQLDMFASSLLVGFQDGTLRWISFGTENENFILNFVTKSHTDAIEYLKLNNDCTILISQGLDSKLFFYSVQKFCLTPIGFYINHHEVVDFAFLKYALEEDKETLLILCKYSYFIEVEIPTTEKCLQIIENRKTFYMETDNFQVYIINGLRTYHELGDRIYDSDCEEQPDLNEAGKEVLNKLKYEEKKEIRERRRSELGLNGPVTPPEILSCLPSKDLNHVWISLGKEDIGYIFEFKFNGKFTEKPIELIPIRALEILTAEIIPVLTMQYSPCGKFLFMGLQDGSLNLCHLAHPFRPDSGYDFAKYQIHDPDFGAIKHLKVSSGGSFISTAGYDGNIFSFFFNMLDVKDYREHGGKPVLTDEVPTVEDLPPGKLSVEDELQFEMNRRFKQTREKIKNSLETLRGDYLNLKEKQLAEYSSLCESSLKKLENVPQELLLIPEKFGTTEMVENMFQKTTEKLMKEGDNQFEDDIIRLELLYEKYFKFYKGRLESEKLELKFNEKTLCAFRACELPSNLYDASLITYPHLFKSKEKTFSEERKKSKNITAEKLKLVEDLLAACKAIIDYPSDTSVSEQISKYNRRKEERIKMLKEHIAEYESIECLVTDKKEYNKTLLEIENSKIKFKETTIFEQQASSGYSSSYDEKKRKMGLYYQEITQFIKFFNSLVSTAVDIQSDKTIIDKNEGIVDIEESGMANWQESLDCKTLCVGEKNRKKEIEAEKLNEQQMAYDSLLSILMAAKPKINCEKKFHDIRFTVKCVELNLFKDDLLQEKKWLKIIKELECMLEEENEKLSALDEKIVARRSERQREKDEWMNVYEQFRKAMGPRHKHKGYFKRVFRKKIRPEDEREPHKRHSSSESSESEQNIESEDDGGCTVDPSEVDQDTLREVMLFRLQRHSVEMRMKRLKRALHTYTAKEVVLQRKIKKIKDAMSEAWIELSSVPTKRKLVWENMNWPTVLYPGNVHKDFFGKQVVSVEEQKVATYAEMSRIHGHIVKELKPINKLINVSLFIAMDRVVNEEISDLIDVADVFFSLVETVAGEVDDYFKKLAYPDVTVEAVKTSDSKEKPVNIIKEILEAAAKEVEISETQLESEEDSSIDGISTKTEMNKVERNKAALDIEPIEKLVVPGVLEEPFDVDFKEPHEIGKENITDHSFTGRKKSLKSWRDVCDDSQIMDRDMQVGSFVIKDILPKMPTLDVSLLADDEHSAHEDYYMQPLHLDQSVQFQKKIRDQPEWTHVEFSKMLIESDVAEVIEDLSGSIVKGKQSNKDRAKSAASFPTYPGGGLILTRHVLASMEKDDPESFPYSSFYQELMYTEEMLEKPKAVHIVPAREEIKMQHGVSQVSFADFILVDIKDIFSALRSFNETETTSFECENQLRILEKKLSKAKNERIYVEQDLLNVARERIQEMDNKFSHIMDLDHLQDVVENPHLRIKKYESDKKVDSLKKELEKLKASEVVVHRSLDKFGLEDTRVCYELWEQRKEFKSLNKKYSAQLEKFPREK